MIKLLYPVKGILTQGFGGNAQEYARFNLPGHNGLDWAVPINTQVKAAYDGTVDKVGWDESGYGNYIKLKHISDDGKVFYTLYAHFNSKPSSAKTFKAGDVVGLSGSTGNSTGPHLHFELILSWQATDKWKGRVDPTTYLSDGVDINEETPSVNLTENSLVRVNADLGLRLRYEPNINSKMYLLAPFGSTFHVGEVKDGWAEIILYASAEYLENV